MPTAVTRTQFVTSKKSHPTLLAVAIASVCLGISLKAQPVLAADNPATTRTETARHQFDIAPGAMNAVLKQIASAAGITLSFDPAQVQGLNSDGIQGNYSIDEAVRMVLSGTRLQVSRTAGGAYLVSNPNSEVTTLPPVKVSDSAIQDGSTESGYVSQKVSQVGPWQGRSLQDTPYSINVVSEDLIENLQATSTDEIFQINPVTQFYYPQAQNAQTVVYLRGFRILEMARNGITRQGFNYANGTATEEVANVEILTGLSGFLYGGGNVGGIVNFVSKRPTVERLNSITIGNTGGENLRIHGDFGGHIDDSGAFGYRINVVAQDGESAVDHLDNERQFISGLLDWQITDNLLLELDLAKHDYHQNGHSAFWSLSPGATRPDADDLDTDKTWGQRWAIYDTESQRAGINLNWKINDRMRIRSGYLDEETERTHINVTNTIQVDGTYDQRIYYNEHIPQTIHGEGYFGFFDVDFSTADIDHSVTFGYQYSDSYWAVYSGSAIILDTVGNSLSAPNYIAEPSWAGAESGKPYDAFHQRTTTLSIGDDIHINDQWSILAGVSNSRIIYENWDVDGNKTSDYDKHDITPTLSVLFKPVENITTYISYMESLEQGGVANETFGALDVVNANEVMEPLISEQVELGLKASVNDMLITAALFEIDKPFEYYQALNSTEAEYVQDGRQVHRGLELTATGKVTDRVTLIAGATWLDAEVKNNDASPQLEGKRPNDVAKHMAKAYVEYDTPWVDRLSVTGAVIYTGKRYGDTTNTDKLDSYTLLNLGARYMTELAGKTTTFRFNINNLTDEAYWANSFYLGEPRAFVMSANVQL